MSAVLGCRLLIRKLIKNTSPSVPRNSTIVIGPLKIVCPNGVKPVMRPAASVTTAALKVSQATTPVRATPAAM
jgi:hypothetical protein